MYASKPEVQEGVIAGVHQGGADGSYTAGLESYLADQFPLRDGWMGLKTRYEYLLGKRDPL